MQRKPGERKIPQRDRSSEKFGQLAQNCHPKGAGPDRHSEPTESRGREEGEEGERKITERNKEIKREKENDINKERERANVQQTTIQAK